MFMHIGENHSGAGCHAIRANNFKPHARDRRSDDRDHGASSGGVSARLVAIQAFARIAMRAVYVRIGSLSAFHSSCGRA
eukprot:5442451-Amphidinium_carterae.1